jgi:hypothetical protein
LAIEFPKLPAFSLNTRETTPQEGSYFFLSCWAAQFFQEVIELDEALEELEQPEWWSRLPGHS